MAPMSASDDNNPGDNENLSLPDSIDNLNDSDSDGFEGGEHGEDNGGYALLDQHAFSDFDDEDDDLSADENQHHNTDDNYADFSADDPMGAPMTDLPPAPPEWRPSPQDLKPHEPKQDVNLDKDQIERIKTAMKAIVLPPTNLPEWAGQVSDDQWKSRLDEIISRTQGQSMETQNN